MYASKTKQPSQGRRSRLDAHEGGTASGYSTGQTQASGPRSQPPGGADISEETLPPFGAARAKRIVEVPKEPHLHNSAGWNRNAEHILDYFLYQEVPGLTPEVRALLVDRVLAKMDEVKEMKRWLFEREENPFSYMPYLTEVVECISRYKLKKIKSYTRWIRPKSYYHLQVLQQDKLNECPHLQFAGHPKEDEELPSTVSLRTITQTFEAAQKNPKISTENFRRARDNLVKNLKVHGLTVKAKVIASIKSRTPTQPPQPSPKAEPKPTHGGGDGLTWAETMEKQEEQWNRARGKANKRRRESSQSRGPPPNRKPVPYPLLDDKDRREACIRLYEVVREMDGNQSEWIFKILRHHLSDKTCTKKDVIHLSNLLFASLNEYHFTAGCRAYSTVSMILPSKIEDQLPPEEDYLP